MDATEIEETKGQANVANDIVVWSLGLVSSVIRWDWFVLYFVGTIQSRVHVAFLL